MNKVAIVDYQTNNIFSIQRACEYAGLDIEITSDRKVIESAAAVILPGVGGFGDAMQNLESLDLVVPLKDFADSGKPMMGVCLGLQLLFSESEEFGIHQGLDIIPGKVKRFSNQNTKSELVKVPQTGWNNIYKKERTWENTPLAGISDGEYMYFVHSFYVSPDDKKCILSMTEYGDTEYCSSILIDNIFAAQFHPEKSATKGLSIYQEWAKIVNNC